MAEASPTTIVAPGILWIMRRHKPEGLELRCLLGAEQPRTVGGYAKIGEVERPKRRSITEYVGAPPVRVDVSFIIDYWKDETEDNPGVECEKDIRKLEKMAGLDPGEGAEEPPQLVWYANAPHDNQENPGMSWWIERLDWGEALWNKHGRRVRAAGTITLVQVVEGGFLQHGKKKKGGGGGGDKRRDRDSNRKGIQKRYKVRKKDKSLRIIAKEQLGNGNYWPRISKLNGGISLLRTKKWPDYLKMP